MKKHEKYSFYIAMVDIQGMLLSYDLSAASLGESDHFCLFFSFIVYHLEPLGKNFLNREVRYVCNVQPSIPAIASTCFFQFHKLRNLP